MGEDLKRLSSHFAFGENWSRYAEKVDEPQIAEGMKCLGRLASKEDIDGRTVIDIGCGSGLHALAFLRSGAHHVTAIDIDPMSVATARSLLAKHAPGCNFEARELSIFEVRPETTDHFDIVYSWGVLHHTGDLRTALKNAAALVAPGGLFIFALYRRTLFCPVWTVIKRWYSKASPAAQQRAMTVYGWLYQLRFLLTGRNFGHFVKTYRSNRGMDFWHDVHDWIGGYPYEPIQPSEVAKIMEREGLEWVRGSVGGFSIGVLGSGCDEFVYRRKT